MGIDCHFHSMGSLQSFNPQETAEFHTWRVFPSKMERGDERERNVWISREVYMCWMNDSEPLAGCRSNRAEWIKEKWFSAWWMSPYHLIYSSSGGGRKCIMLFVSISWNRDNLWIISIRWKPTSVVKHFVFAKNIGFQEIHTNRFRHSLSSIYSPFIMSQFKHVVFRMWAHATVLWL